MKSAAIRLFFLVLIASNLGAQIAPNCDNSCGGSDPSSPSMIAARTSINAARGTGSAIVASTSVLSRTIAIQGSQSYTYGVPMFSLPGRAGLNVNLSLFYNSFVWTGDSSHSLTFNADHDTPSPGFRLDFGYIEWDGVIGGPSGTGVLVETDGSKHLLGGSANPSISVTNDSTYIQVLISSGVAGSPNIATFKNGMQVFYTYASGWLFRPTKIEDTNGNFITVSYVNNTDLKISSITDTVGRTINFLYDPSGQMLQCVTTAANCTTAGTQTYTFSWNPSYPLTFNFSNSTGTLQSGQQVLQVLTRVQRPDGTRVTFSYGDWGIVNQIQELSSSGQVRSSVSYNFPAAGAGPQNGNPAYTQETIFDAVNTGTWNYQATTDPTTGEVTSLAVTDPCGTTTTTNSSGGLTNQVQVTSNPPSSPPAGCPSVPSKTWRTRNQTWSFDANGVNPRPANITNILEDNTQSQIVYNAYDANGNPTDVLEYDFGAGAPGPLLRETVTSYAALSNHILNRTSDIQIKDASGKIISHQTFNYDQTAVQPVSPLPGMHDETGYGPSSTATRGNLTSSVAYGNPAAGTGAVTTTITYDELGNAVVTSSGCCTRQQQNFSIGTQYAFSDSIAAGPSGSQLTTSFVYNMASGTVAASTDTNGQQTTFTYDIDNRLVSTRTPDGIVSTRSFDDSSANASATASNSANSLVTKSVVDGQGRVLTAQILNGTSLVSTTTSSYNVIGETIQSSNPYGPGETPVYTVFGYDALGRAISTTPPVVAGAASQNSYQTLYSAATTTSTDPAGKQRKQYGNALGRLIRVDEPGLLGAAYAAGSLTIAGSEQSVATQSGNGATAGTANMTVGGAERSTQVQTHWATSATVTITIGGADGTNTAETCARTCTFHNIKDSGTMQFTVVSAGSTIGPVSVSYNGTSTPASLAAALYAAFPANSVVSISNPNGTASFTLTTTAVGSATNSSTISTAIASGCVDSDLMACGPQGWTMTLSGPGLAATTASSASFTGGTDNIFTTVYDTGNVTVSITVNGTAYSKSAAYGQSSTAGSIANDLYNKFIADSSFSQLVRVNPPGSGTTLQFTTVATGANTNYPLSIGAATTSSNFAAGSTSFTVAPVGSSSFTPGQNGTLYDTGTVTLSVLGFTSAMPPSKTVSYGQGSTAAGIASLLATQVHSDSLFPVDASVAPGSATINLTARNKGADSNSYQITVSAQSNLSGSFANPSFPNTPASSASISAALSGGTDGTPSFDPSVVLTTTYSYDPVGNLLQVSQGQQTRTYVYDGFGRVTSSTIPETGYQTAFASYTDFGAPAQIVDPRIIPGTSTHITTTFAYDSLNRPQTIAYNDGTPGVTYTYNPPGSANNTGGRLASVTNGVASETYQYDVMGRPLQCAKTIGGQSYVIGYSYRPDGTLASTTYPSGRTVAATVDGIGRLTQIATNGSSLLTIGAYSSAGAVVSATYGNGMQASYGYNSQLQLSSIQYGSAGSTLMSLSYSYAGAQNNGQIQSITDNLTPSRSLSYVYDELGRLKTGQTNDLTSANTWKLKYTYDRYGNRLSQIPTAGTATMPLNEINVDPTTNRISGSGYLYDAGGNVVSDGLYNYTFDAASRLTSVAPVPGLPGNPANFAYDAAGQRVNKNGVVYIYSGGQVIAEYANGAAASSPSVEYLYAGGLLASVSGGATTYYYADHLSNRNLANGSGAQTGTSALYPFGENWTQSGTTTKWAFTNYEGDRGAGESGLDYANARFYSSRVGRFMSMDPLSGSMGNPQSLNRYLYVANDPINFSDPTGMEMRGNLTCLLDNQGNCTNGGAGGTCIIDGISSYCGFAQTLAGMDDSIDCNENLCGPTAVSGPDGDYVGFITPSYGIDGSISYSSTFDAYRSGVLLTAAALAEALGLPGGTQTPGAGPRPAACNGVTADDLKYDIPLPRGKGKMETGAQHIYNNHINGNPLTKSQYKNNFPLLTPKSQLWPFVINTNKATFNFGTWTGPSKKNPYIVFEYDVPMPPPIPPPINIVFTGIGTVPGGKETTWNRLVLGSNCRVVVTSYAFHP